MSLVKIKAKMDEIAGIQVHFVDDLDGNSEYHVSNEFIVKLTELKQLIDEASKK